MDAFNIQFTKIELEIAIYIFKQYQTPFNARQLAKKLHVNHAHANKLCNLLTKKMLLRKQTIGNADYFSYNYENKSATNFMEYLLTLEENNAPTWLAVVVHCLQTFREHLTMGLLFGSATQTSAFHDVDVLLIYHKKKARTIKKIKKYILRSNLVRQPIRYVDITEADIYKNRKDTVFYSILSNSRVFHNAEKYVEVIKRCHK